MSIVQDGDPVLRKKAAEVPASAFKSEELADTIRQMFAALDAEHNGVALAAPQIGISKRIFVVRYDRMRSDPVPDAPPEEGVYINPQILKTSRKKAAVDEGCLSVAGVFGKTERYTRATVRAYDEHGRRFERGAGGLLAQAFQHEIDHLDGVLFVDHATDLRTNQHDA